jgi:hypothetical protein
MNQGTRKNDSQQGCDKASGFHAGGSHEGL